MNHRTLLSLLMLITLLVMFSPGKTLAFKSDDKRSGQPINAFHTYKNRDVFNGQDINTDFGIV